jgi:hypothetical protein
LGKSQLKSQLKSVGETLAIGIPIAAFVGLTVAIGASAARAAHVSTLPIPELGKRKGVKGTLAFFHVIRTPWYGRDKNGAIVQRKGKNGKGLTRLQIKETPAELKEDAQTKLGRQIGDSAFALATMIASEQERSRPYVKGAIANTAKNMADSREVSVFELLTTGSGSDGTFGDQLGHYASTRHPPTEEDLLIAEAVLDGKLPDVTGNAIHFDSPKVQDKLVSENETGYLYSADQLAARRAKKGLIPFYLPDTDPNELRFWRRA